MIPTHAAELTLAADADAIAVAVAAVLDHCRDWTVPEDALFQIELGLTEALNNIVQHACTAPSQPTVLIALRYNGRTLDLTLSDPGTAMTTPPAPDLPAALDEGGRGWFIIYACFDEVIYTRHAAENHLTLRKLLPLEAH